MNLLNPIGLVIVGLVLLLGGGELLVRGASRLAAALGVSPLLIGLTVVAFGTSSPELAVSIQSSFAGQADLAIGNVVGSNILNVLLILGISSLLAPLVVAAQIVRWDVPLMIGASLLSLALALDRQYGRIDGAVLFASLLLYIAWSIRQSRRESRQIKEEFAREYGEERPPSAPGRIVINLVLIAVGLGLLILGSRWLVQGSTEIARLLGVSELIIGLTIIALGTSMPEVVTSAVASVRGERDIAVGNVVGSNLFNLLCVLGVASLVSPQPIRVAEAVLWFDMPVMIGVAVACLPIFFTGHRISRWEGALFLAYYVAYTTYLILDATEHDRLGTFNWVMGSFVIPLTTVTLIVLAVREWRRARAASS